MAVGMGAKHLTDFKEEDQNVLVKIVKNAQHQKIKGKRGEWKEFVAVINKHRGGTLNDPAKHPVDVLSSFVQTFTKQEDIEMVRRIRKWGKNQASKKLLDKTQQWPKSPEQELVELTQSHPRFRVFYSFPSWNEVHSSFFSEFQTLNYQPAAKGSLERAGESGGHCAYVWKVSINRRYKIYYNEGKGSSCFFVDRKQCGATYYFSHQQILCNPRGWKWPKRGDTSSPIRLVSLDCEMVICEGDEEEIVRVCAVDHNCNTLIDELVLPSRKVEDYVTSITGVTAKNLEGVTFTQAAAQKLVKKLLTPGTILVGHSLYHDLKAMKIDHKRVIDTALLFRDSSWPVAYNLSLSNLCKVVLKYNFREEGKPHDCLEDAIIPMRLVQYWLQHGVNNICLTIPQKEVTREVLSKLFLHKIPHHVKVAQLRALFPEKVPCEIQNIVMKKRSKTSSTSAIFQSMEDADKAFAQLEGQLAKDSVGYPQKTVTMTYKDGKYVRLAEIQVRKMCNERTVIVTDLESGEIEDDSMVDGMRKRLSDDLLKADFEEGGIRPAKRVKNGTCSLAVLEPRAEMKVDAKSRSEEGEKQEPQENGVSNSSEVCQERLEEGLNSSTQVTGKGNKYDGVERSVGIKVLEGDTMKRSKVERTCACDHVHELNSARLELAKVRQELNAKASEVKSLQKLVAALSRKSGLV